MVVQHKYTDYLLWYVGVKTFFRHQASSILYFIILNNFKSCSFHFQFGLFKLILKIVWTSREIKRYKCLTLTREDYKTIPLISIMVAIIDAIKKYVPFDLFTTMGK